MVLTTHALAGAVIGKSVNNPWIIITLSVGTHFILDMLPHGEYISRYSKIKDSYWKVILDCLIGIAIISFIIYIQRHDKDHPYNVYFGAFSSMFPDFLTFLNSLFRGKIKLLKKIYKFHQWTHSFHPAPSQREWKLRNILNDILISGIAIIILFSL